MPFHSSLWITSPTRDCVKLFFPPQHLHPSPSFPMAKIIFVMNLPQKLNGFVMVIHADTKKPGSTRLFGEIPMLQLHQQISIALLVGNTIRGKECAGYMPLIQQILVTARCAGPVLLQG